MTKIILELMGLLLLVNIDVELLFLIRENSYVKFNRDIDPRKIKISNDGYGVVEKCSAKVNKMYVIGKNQTCERMADCNWDYALEWDDKSKNMEIPNGTHVLLDVFDVSDEKIVLLFQDMNLPLPIYRDLENGKDARKGKYQLEIQFHGLGKTQGGTDNLKKRSRWEIDYQSGGKGKAPTFKMAKIKKMMKPTGKIDDEEFSNGSAFDLYLKKG